MDDRNIFNQIVYTPLSEALRLLEERQKDPVLMAKVNELLKGDIPEVLKNKKCGVLCRQIATPNNETRMFLSIAKDNNFSPVLLEFQDDKFTSNNKYKHSLGKLFIKNDDNLGLDSFIDEINIIDFTKHDGKKLRDIVTLWEEPLVDFHRRLFVLHDYNTTDFDFHDVSLWLKNNGDTALNYYTNLLTLFTCYGILFENFLISKDSEGDFTEKIVLPAIEKVINLTGVKPLIVPIEPMDLETENFWLHHLSKVKTLIPKK